MKREISIAFQTDKTPQRYIDLARLVNRYDFDAVSVYGDPPYQPSFGPLLIMAPHIHHARLGPAGVSPSRMHPIDMAANTALLALTAPGGAYLGMVRGAWLAEHGITEVAQPIAAIRESAAIVKRLLRGEEGGYQGSIYQIAPHVRAPYPLPQEDIPILIGSWGPKLCAVAGEVADELKVGGSANPDLVPIIRERIMAGERVASRPEGTVGIVMGAVSVVDEDRDTARALARREVALYLPVVAGLDPTLTIDPALLDRIDLNVKSGEFDSAAAMIPDDLLDRLTLSGNPNDVIAQCEALFEAGTARIEFGTPHGMPPEKGIRLIGEKVLPALHR